MKTNKLPGIKLTPQQKRQAVWLGGGGLLAVVLLVVYLRSKANAGTEAAPVSVRYMGGGGGGGLAPTDTAATGKTQTKRDDSAMYDPARRAPGTIEIDTRGGSATLPPAVSIDPYLPRYDGRDMVRNGGIVPPAGDVYLPPPANPPGEVTGRASAGATLPPKLGDGATTPRPPIFADRNANIQLNRPADDIGRASASPVGIRLRAGNVIAGQ